MKKATAALATLLILTTAGCTSSAQNGKTQAPLWAQGRQKPQNEAGVVGQEG
ncbi:hypothetical protein [Streptomyces lavendulae]|uniref:hypothetical protein n=1 Tax=Streptomyces lavendulae TaxID=1914 RepID=UPI0033F81672